MRCHVGQEDFKLSWGAEWRPLGLDKCPRAKESARVPLCIQPPALLTPASKQDPKLLLCLQGAQAADGPQVQGFLPQGHPL